MPSPQNTRGSTQRGRRRRGARRSTPLAAVPVQGSENRKFAMAWLAKLGQPWFVGLPVA
jgi:hypothetical protein